MRDIQPSTSNETKLFKALQEKIGAYPNGIIGCQTMSDLAIELDVDCFPITLQIYGQPVIIGNDILPYHSKGSLNGFSNSMLGSFTYPRATMPCSILVSNGKTVCGNSCHAHISKPESVIYKDENGNIKIDRVLSAGQLPKNIKWAVGGMGLCDMYDPQAEGFTGAYGDVLRKTNHNVLGVKNGKLYGVYYKNMTGQQINKHCKEKMKFDMAILLDGGGLAAINGSEDFAKINTKAKQGYAIQFI